jgi:hypothetical protein
MGCGTCGDRAAKATAQYPREVVLGDGTRVTVSSSADERTQRERYRQRERAAAKVKGYTASR